MTISHLTGHLGIMFDPSLVLRLFLHLYQCMYAVLFITLHDLHISIT